MFLSCVVYIFRRFNNRGFQTLNGRLTTFLTVSVFAFVTAPHGTGFFAEYD